MNWKRGLKELKDKILVPIIQGQTAIGKSKIAFELAKMLDFEIVSADSRQVYEHLDIGTAKPTQSERLRIKHHLIDFLPLNEQYNAGNFVNDAQKIIVENNKKNKLSIIVGGTGFYIKSLLSGLADIPPTSESDRKMVEDLIAEKGVNHLYEILKEKNPNFSERVHFNDNHRIQRNYEVFITTGKSLEDFWELQKEKQLFQPLNILITQDRDKLYHKINDRVDKMLDKGLLKEVANLLNAGFSENDFGLNTVGYKELIPFIKYGKNLNSCIDKVKQHSRNFAKRQMTWYRKIDFDKEFNLTYLSVSEVVESIFKMIKN